MLDPFYQHMGVALVASTAPMLTVLLTYRKQKGRLEAQDERVAEIHVLVNSRLSQALDEIDTLKATVQRKEDVIAERDAPEGVGDPPSEPEPGS